MLYIIRHGKTEQNKKMLMQGRSDHPLNETGIRQAEGSAGFGDLIIDPHPDRRLEWLEASLETEKGTISSGWAYTVDGGLRYEITVPGKACVVIGGRRKTVEKGSYIFYEKA